MGILLPLFWVHTYEQNGSAMGQVYMKVDLKRLPFSKWLYQFTRIKRERSVYFPSLPTCDVISLFNFRHPSGCVVVSYCGFNLHFLND